MQWCHKLVMDIVLNKRPLVVSWDNLKECMHARFVPPHYRKDLLLKLQRFCTVQVIGCDDVDKRKVGGQEVNIVAV